jgi:hypothetical protein
MAHTANNEPWQILSASGHGCHHKAVSYDNLRVSRVLHPTEKRGNDAGSRRGWQGGRVVVGVAGSGG